MSQGAFPFHTAKEAASLLYSFREPQYTQLHTIFLPPQCKYVYSAQVSPVACPARRPTMHPQTHACVVTPHQAPAGACSAAAPQTQSSTHLQQCILLPAGAVLNETETWRQRGGSQAPLVRRSRSSGSHRMLSGH